MLSRLLKACSERQVWGNKELTRLSGQAPDIASRSLRHVVRTALLIDGTGPSMSEMPGYTLPKCPRRPHSQPNIDNLGVRAGLATLAPSIAGVKL
jgi:hypothetical protein